MATKVSPVKPSEMTQAKKSSIPDVVFEVFNQLITEKFNCGYATIKQKDVVALLEAKGLKSREIYDRGWLDVEGVYRAAGWKVEYDKPGYNESYDAFFVFSTKSR